jgi:RNA polymerase sigma-70 factor (ECF subfamily)
MYLRKQKGKHQQQIETIPLADSNEEESTLIIEKEEQLILLEQAIKTLKDEQKQCIELFYLQDRSYQEISDRLKISLNTVKSAIQNGKRNIKIWMERHENNKTRA